ncbi:hypothetical protein [Haloplanus salinus]|jgi:hypothetical protein|uniref:hypothetical protein n=1 Tax=Haloplanus salinus TaxID=1126245 RepID=UPI0015F0908E|nr:hypothetical protein [Haloplanus salinus]
MVGVLSRVYAVAAIAAAVVGLLFILFGTGDRERELLVGGLVGIVLLLGLGATLLT